MIPHSRPLIGLEERRAVDRVLKTGQVAQGPEVLRLEQNAARFLGLKGGAAVSSGTKALEFALRALGAGPGKEVLIPSYVCSALWHAVGKTGAKAVLVDCEPGGANLSLEDAARKKTRKTRAIIIPHLFGEPVNMDKAKALRVPIVEDCAQALGAKWEGRRLGSFGSACVLSFYATKLVCAGEGGMVLSSRAGLLEKARHWREYDGKTPDCLMENAKMTDMQAALANAQWKRLPGFLARRSRLAAAYDEAFRGLDVRLPSRAAGRVYFRYVLRVNDRSLDPLLKNLRKAGICASRPVFRPLHWDVPCSGKFPQADLAWRESLSLPLYPVLTGREQDEIIQKMVLLLRDLKG